MSNDKVVDAYYVNDQLDAQQIPLGGGGGISNVEVDENGQLHVYIQGMKTLSDATDDLTHDATGNVGATPKAVALVAQRVAALEAEPDFKLTIEDAASDHKAAENHAVSPYALKQVEAKADTAQAGADHAQSTADAAQEAANVAIGKADTAQAGADHAQSTADAAQEAANVAIGKADTAQAGADHAQSTADAAQEAANVAIGKADTAQADVNRIQEGIDNGTIGGSSSTVKAPSTLSPTGANAHITPTLSAAPYNSLVASDTRAYREFQLVAATGDYESPLISVQVNQDSYTPDWGATDDLALNTEYKWRCRDVSVWGASSPWTEATFTTVPEAGIVTPVIYDITGGTAAVPANPTISATEYQTVGISEPHASSEWRISEKDGDEVWSTTGSLDLTSTTVEAGYLEPGKTYVVKVRYKSSNYVSDWGEMEFTTKANFTTITTPTLTVEGEPSDVPETPLITASEFQVVSDTDETDTHVSTDWQIVKSSEPGVPVWESLTDTVNKTSIEVPLDELEESTEYIAKCTYHGATYTSDTGTKTFTTSSAFTYIAAPTLSVEGAPNEVPEQPVLNGGAFTVITETEDEDTHECTDWKIVKVSDSTTVWESLNDSSNLTTVTVPAEKLTVATQYKVSCRYKGTAFGWSDWAETTVTTMEQFVGPKTPVISVRESTGSVSSVDIGTLFEASPFEYIGGTDTMDQQEWTLFAADDASYSSPLLTYTAGRVMLPYPGYKLTAGASYKLRYRYHAKTAAVWSNYAELAFTASSTLTFPTIKFTMKNSINLSKLCKWWDADKLQVHKNGVLDAEMTANYANDHTLSAEGDQIEIINFAGGDIYPFISFAKNENIVSIDAPLPPLYDDKDGTTLVTDFGGDVGDATGIFYNAAGTAINTAPAQGSGSNKYGMFTSSSVQSLAPYLFVFNPQVKNMGGMGGGGGGGTYYGGNGGNGGGGYGGGGGVGGGGEVFDGGVGYGCFQACAALTTLPEGLFANCVNLANLGGYGGGGGGGSAGGGRGGVGGNGGGCFQSCAALTTLPEGLFADCVNLANLGGYGGGGGGGDGGGGGSGGGCFYNCTALTTLPEGLFANCVNLTNLGGYGGGGGGGGSGGGRGYGCFYNCTALTTLPEGLFANCVNLANLGGYGGGGAATAFDGGGGGGGGYGGGGGGGYGDGGYAGGAGGNGAGGNGGGGGGGRAGGVGGSQTNPDKTGNSHGTFENTGVTAIPEGLYRNCIALANAYRDFFSCKSLTTVGDKIFEGCTSLESVENAFRDCPSLSSVGMELTKGCVSLQDVSQMFQNCTSLTVTQRFDAENISSASNFANGTAAKGTVYVPAGSTTLSTFQGDSSANVNAIAE